MWPRQAAGSTDGASHSVAPPRAISTAFDADDPCRHYSPCRHRGQRRRCSPSGRFSRRIAHVAARVRASRASIELCAPHALWRRPADQAVGWGDRPRRAAAPRNTWSSEPRCVQCAAPLPTKRGRAVSAAWRIGASDWEGSRRPPRWEGRRWRAEARRGRRPLRTQPTRWRAHPGIWS